MDKIYKNVMYNYDELSNITIPKNEIIDNKLKYWLSYNKIDNHDILEKIINTIEPNNYIDYIDIIHNNEFKLLTKNNDSIIVSFNSGNEDEYPQIIINKNNIINIYQVYYYEEENKVLINSFITKDIKNNFIQYYFNNADMFEKTINDNVYCFYIANPNYYSLNDRYLLNDKLKEDIKHTNNDNIISLFSILTNYINSNDIPNYSIIKHKTTNLDSLEYIVVTDGNLSKIKLSKKLKKKTVTIEEDIRKKEYIKKDNCIKKDLVLYQNQKNKVLKLIKKEM